MKMIACTGCSRPILDRFLLSISDDYWHSDCVTCCECKVKLTEKCFYREGKLYCRSDFFKKFGTKCAGCLQGIQPTDFVRRAKSQVYHVTCFTCFICRRQLSTGEETYVTEDNSFICKKDYLSSWHNNYHQDTDSLSESSSPSDSGQTIGDNSYGPLSPVTSSGGASSSGGLTRLDDLTGNSLVQTTNTHNTSLMTHNSNSNHNSGGSEGSVTGRGSANDENSSGTKRRGPRTTIKAKQLETLKNAFNQTPKPTRHIREQLAAETGLNMRVIQVWFQNRRSKERRMKQMNSLGARRHFFRNPRRAMRPLRPGGLEPQDDLTHLDDSPEVVGGPPDAFGFYPANEPTGWSAPPTIGVGGEVPAGSYGVPGGPVPDQPPPNSYGYQGYGM